MAGDKRLEKANEALDEEIALFREQVAQAKRRRARQGAAVAAVSGPAQPGDGQVPASTAALPAAATPMQETIPAEQDSPDQTARDDVLAEQGDRILEHMTQIRTWLNTEPELRPMAKRFVGELESRSLRQNVMLNVVLSTIFLLAGWLLSVVATPTLLARVFGH